MYYPVATVRTIWLIVVENAQTCEIKYFISNAPVKESLKTLLEIVEIAFCHWYVEKCFERAKQECGLGCGEGEKVKRSYHSNLR